MAIKHKLNRNRKSGSKSHKKSNKKNYNKNYKSKKTYKNHAHKNKKKTKTILQRQRGGFNSCSLATVQEPGISIPAIDDIPGINIPQSKGVIYRPNCKSDTYQAMIPL
jgi:hypothetical protein